MDQYEFIRTANRVYGKNINELSGMTGHSRNTIKKALREEFGGYRVREKQPFPAPGPYLEIIDDWRVTKLKLTGGQPLLSSETNGL